MIPLKTGDIVIYNGKEHLINGIAATKQAGTQLELLPISSQRKVVHSSEVRLKDEGEYTRRIKATMPDGEKEKSKIDLPNGITVEEANMILKKFSEKIRGE